MGESGVSVDASSEASIPSSITMTFARTFIDLVNEPKSWGKVIKVWAFLITKFDN